MNSTTEVKIQLISSQNISNTYISKAIQLFLINNQ